MKIEKVLFHTRFRELAFNALEAVLELKKVGLKEILFHKDPWTASGRH
jgi:hypothetical protein